MEKVYEMFWDCSYCGANKLLGKTHRHCPQCGSAQDPGKRYFPPEEEKVAVQDHVYFGADWTCSSCQTPNSSAAEFCGNCGTPQEGAEKVSLVGEAAAAAPPPAPPPPEKKAKAKAKKSGGGWGRILLGCVFVFGLGLMALCAVSIFWTRSETATVTGHTWERSIQLQEYRASSDTDWCDEMPSGAYSVRKSEKKRDTKKVPDGETCTTKNVDNGDGTFRQEEDCKTNYREEPIYGDWCSYTVDKWADLREAEANGDGLSPVWPQVQLNTCNRTAVGCQREGNRESSYALQVRDSGGDSHICSLAESAWRGVRDGQKIEITVKVLGGGVSCNL